jgi:hypothetical protein
MSYTRMVTERGAKDMCKGKKKSVTNVVRSQYSTE